jgi:CubicO group peptidase (beta-lactamase class C family)
MMEQLTSTDGILIMKDGVVIVEQYRNGFDPYTRHNAFSMTKSFAGVMVSMLIDDGTIESDNDLILKYIPELNIDGGAFQVCYRLRLYSWCMGVNIE